MAQAVDWIPDLTHDIIQMGFRHRGFAFIRVLQRCPEYMEHRYDPWVQEPDRMLLLEHEDGLRIGTELGRIYRNRESHDPSDRNRAREIAAVGDPIPVGILYRNEGIPCYEDRLAAETARGAAAVARFLETEFDKFSIEPLESAR